jgi:hypothetical protein
VLKVHSALAAVGTDLYDVMAGTGLSLLDARRALAQLTAAGHAAPAGPGRYARA